MTQEFRTCMRTGCRWPAVAALSYHYASRQVWVIDLAGERDPNLYDLCPHHADALTVPQGWERVDQRTISPAVVEPSAPERAAAARATVTVSPHRSEGQPRAWHTPTRPVEPPGPHLSVQAGEADARHDDARVERTGGAPPTQKGASGRYAELFADLPRLAREVDPSARLELAPRPPPSETGTRRPLPPLPPPEAGASRPRLVPPPGAASRAPHPSTGGNRLRPREADPDPGGGTDPAAREHTDTAHRAGEAFGPRVPSPPRVLPFLATGAAPALDFVAESPQGLAPRVDSGEEHESPDGGSGPTSITATTAPGAGQLEGQLVLPLDTVGQATVISLADRRRQPTRLNP